MGKKSKKFIDKSSAIKFHVVHRSVQEEEKLGAGQFLLQPTTEILPHHLPRDFPNEVLHGYNANTNNRTPEEESELEKQRKAQLDRAAIDPAVLSHDYDYSQHLRPIGSGVFIPSVLDEDEDLIHVNARNKLKEQARQQRFVDPRYVKPTKKKSASVIAADSASLETHANSESHSLSLSSNSSASQSTASTLSSSASSSSALPTSSAAGGPVDTDVEEAIDEDLKLADPNLVAAIEKSRRGAAGGGRPAMFRRKVVPKDFEMSMDDEDENQWEELEDDFVSKAMGLDLKNGAHKLDTAEDDNTKVDYDKENDQHDEEDEEEMQEDKEEKKVEQRKVTLKKVAFDKDLHLYGDEDADSADFEGDEDVEVEEFEEFDDEEDEQGNDKLSSILQEYEDDDDDDDAEPDDEDDEQDENLGEEEKSDANGIDRPKSLHRYDDLVLRVEGTAGAKSSNFLTDNADSVEAALKLSEDEKAAARKVIEYQQAQDSKLTTEDEQRANEEFDAQFEPRAHSEWDAESIVSTYTNTENIPKSIPLTQIGNIHANKATQKIKLNRFGIPKGVLKKEDRQKLKTASKTPATTFASATPSIPSATSGTTPLTSSASSIQPNALRNESVKTNGESSEEGLEEASDSSDMGDDVSVSGSVISSSDSLSVSVRPRDETVAEKRDRKAACKSARREKRAQKKSLKVLYRSERHQQAAATSLAKSTIPANAVKIF